MSSCLKLNLNSISHVVQLVGNSHLHFCRWPYIHVCVYICQSLLPEIIAQIFVLWESLNLPLVCLYLMFSLAVMWTCVHICSLLTLSCFLCMCFVLTLVISITALEMNWLLLTTPPLLMRVFSSLLGFLVSLPCYLLPLPPQQQWLFLTSLDKVP